MSTSRRSILIDGSPLLGGSGHRGIGRFIQDLLLGLSETGAEWSGDLDLRVVSDFDWRGSAQVTDDLEQAVASMVARRGTRPLRWSRRLHLGRAARSADLLHLTEALGTPVAQHPRTVVTCYDLIPLRLPEHYLDGNPLKYWRQRWADGRRYGRAARVVAISERTKRDLVDVLHLDPEKIDVVRLGVQRGQWSPEPDPEDERRLASVSVGARPYSLYVGYGDHRKGIDAMMRALARVREHVDVELVWAAKLRDKDVRRHTAVAKAAGVEGHVRFLGYVDDATLASLYRRAAVHLFLSKLEGFGLSVAEAIASGCPVVVVQGSGTEEVAGDAAFTVGPDDAEAAAAAVLRLLRDPAERARRVALGLERARTLDRRVMARAYVQVFRDVLSG